MKTLRNAALVAAFAITLNASARVTGTNGSPEPPPPMSNFVLLLSLAASSLHI